MTEFEDINQEHVEKLIKLGASDAQIVDFFNVHPATWKKWRALHKEFDENIDQWRRDWKRKETVNVEKALCKRAKGFATYETKFIVDKDGNVQQVKARKAVAPDTKACMFWLTNQKPEEWADSKNVSLQGKFDITQKRSKVNLQDRIDDLTKDDDKDENVAEGLENALQ